VKIEDLRNINDINSLKRNFDKETISKVFKDVKPEETSKMNEDLLRCKNFIINFVSKNS
jgi:hypothetical protein